MAKQVATISVKRGWLVVEKAPKNGRNGRIDWHKTKPHVHEQHGDWTSDGPISGLCEVDNVTVEQSHASPIRIPRACKIKLVIDE